MLIKAFASANPWEDGRGGSLPRVTSKAGLGGGTTEERSFRGSWGVGCRHPRRVFAEGTRGLQVFSVLAVFSLFLSVHPFSESSGLTQFFGNGRFKKQFLSQSAIPYTHMSIW